MQVQQKRVHIQSFGGLNFINDYLKRQSFQNIVTAHLGPRSMLAQYSYADLLQQLFFIAAMGGDTLDESNILKEQLKDHPHLAIASPDTLEYAFQELRRSNINITTPQGVCHQVNEHEGFNKLLVTLCSNMTSSRQSCMMDYDGHILQNTKADNAFTYKQTEGYYPVVCSINKLPVYMQNSPDSYQLFFRYSLFYFFCKLLLHYIFEYSFFIKINYGDFFINFIAL